MLTKFATTLQHAWSRDCTLSGDDPRENAIRRILVESNHKTYKYVLITGLLGAAANWNNPLVLQKGSKLPRAWDARSVCHKVVVPFEREFLLGRLGNSNEPFLNKPARFAELSTTNAVRSGRDRQVLNELIRLFESIKNPEDAFDLLTRSLVIIKDIPPASLRVMADIHTTEIYEVIASLGNAVIHGEALTFCAFIILSSILDEAKFRAKVHPVNQSGASGRQVGDIDVISLETKNIEMAVEIKDKPFSLHDLNHARSKAVESGVRQSLFVTRAIHMDLATSPRQVQELRNTHSIVSFEELLSVFRFSRNNLDEARFQGLVEEYQSAAKPSEQFAETFSQLMK